MAKKIHQCYATALTSLIMLFQLRFIWQELKIQLVGIMRVCVLCAFKVMKTNFRGVVEH